MPPADWKSRPLADGEKEIAHLMFRDAIDSSRIRILREKAVFFQPRDVTMAPDGNIYFHPASQLANSSYATDFSTAPLQVRAHLVHELTHVCQHQNGSNLILDKVIMFFLHGPLGGYEYEIIPGKPFTSYNIEQQACIMADRYRALCEPSEGNSKLMPFPSFET